MDDAQIKVFVDKSEQLREELDSISKLIFHTKPHPVNKGALLAYRDDLKVIDLYLYQGRNEIMLNFPYPKELKHSKNLR